MLQHRFERLFNGSELAGTDWPLSLGYRIHLITDSPIAKTGFRKDSVLIDELLAAQKTDHSDSQGLACEYSDGKVYLIVIRASENGSAVLPGRLIELIVHECSHVVDYVFSNTSVKACTETRAYTMDWLVGKAINAVLPHLWESPALPTP